MVTIFDNFSNSTKDSISTLVDIGAKVIEGDITKPLNILNAAKEQNVVIHLAAKTSVSESRCPGAPGGGGGRDRSGSQSVAE